MQTIKTSSCYFNKEQHTLSIPSEIFGGGFPREFLVKSCNTGKIVKFVPVPETSRYFDPDFGDGEQAIYIPEIPLPNVVTLTVYHAW